MTVSPFVGSPTDADHDRPITGLRSADAHTSWRYFMPFALTAALRVVRT